MYLRCTVKKKGAFISLGINCPIPIAVPSVAIAGADDEGGDLHAKAGSDVQIHCDIKNVLQKPKEISW